MLIIEIKLNVKTIPTDDNEPINSLIAKYWYKLCLAIYFINIQSSNSVIIFVQFLLRLTALSTIRINCFLAEAFYFSLALMTLLATKNLVYISYGILFIININGFISYSF